MDEQNSQRHLGEEGYYRDNDNGVKITPPPASGNRGLIKVMSVAVAVLLIIVIVLAVALVTSHQSAQSPLKPVPTSTLTTRLTPQPTETPTMQPTPTPTEPGSTPSPILASSPGVPGSLFLSDLKPIGGYPSDENTQPTSLDGINYVGLVRQDLYICEKRQMDYDLGKKYTTFTAKVGLRDMYADTATPWIFALYAVDANGERTLFKQVMKFGQVADVNVSVSGVLRLRLSIEWIDPGNLVTCSPYNSYDAVWANPILIP